MAAQVVLKPLFRWSRRHYAASAMCTDPRQPPRRARDRKIARLAWREIFDGAARCGAICTQAQRYCRASDFHGEFGERRLPRTSFSFSSVFRRS